MYENALNRREVSYDVFQSFSVLKELEEEKLITRTVYPVVPPKVEYSITELGKTLVPLITEIRNWGTFHIENLNK